MSHFFEEKLLTEVIAKHPKILYYQPEFIAELIKMFSEVDQTACGVFDGEVWKDSIKAEIQRINPNYHMIKNSKQKVDSKREDKLVSIDVFQSEVLIKGD